MIWDYLAILDWRIIHVIWMNMNIWLVIYGILWLLLGHVEYQRINYLAVLLFRIQGG